jgi:hypothetical protein
MVTLKESFSWESLKERDHSEDRGVDGRLESEWLLERLAGGCGVDSAGSGYGPWRDLVNAVMNFRVLAPWT